jgi:hypothetical protein
MLTPVKVSRSGDSFTVTCDVNMARRITQQLARTRDHVSGCPDCRADINPTWYARLIAAFDNVFMHVDGDGEHSVTVHDPDRAGAYASFPDWVYEPLLTSTMFSVIADAEEAGEVDDGFWVCHVVSPTECVYDHENNEHEVTA